MFKDFASNIEAKFILNSSGSIIWSICKQFPRQYIKYMKKTPQLYAHCATCFIRENEVF